MARRMGLIPSQQKGSQFRQDKSGAFRDLVAAGGPTFTAVANAASGAMTYTFVETCILGRLTIIANAAVALVAAADAAEKGSYVTGLALSGNALVSGNVPASMFEPRSTNSPLFGHTVVPAVSGLVITILNESGAGLEYGSGFSAL